MIFIRNEAKVPNLETKEITVTEVRMSPDLKVAKAFVLPLGGKNSEASIEKLKEFSFIVRKVLSKKIEMKFLPKILFVTTPTNGLTNITGTTIVGCNSQIPSAKSIE